jgi:hypothetical protein
VWKAANSEQAHLNSREVRGSGPLLGGVKVIEIILESKVIRSWEHRVVTYLSTKSLVAIGGQLLGGGKVIEIILITEKVRSWEHRSRLSQTSPPRPTSPSATTSSSS